MNEAQKQDFGAATDSVTHDEEALTLGDQVCLIGRRAGHEAPASGDAGVSGPEANGAKVWAILDVQRGDTPVYLSGVLWLTIVSLVAMVFPSAREWLEANPVEVASVLGAVNVILRFVTSGRKRLSGVGKGFAEPSGDQDGGADESAPRASNTSGAGGSALLLMMGMCLVMMSWACSSADKQTAASVALKDGRMVVIRGGSSLVIDRDDFSVSWSQRAPETVEAPDVVVEPGVAQGTGK